MKQNFAKINVEANRWPAAEVEWIDDIQLSEKFQSRTVTVMNLYGELTTIPYSNLSFHFQDSYTFASEPMVLQIRKSHLRNCLIHFLNTGESILKYTLRIPDSWISFREAQIAYWEEIENALHNLKNDKDIDIAYEVIANIVSGYKYRLGSIQVNFV